MTTIFDKDLYAAKNPYVKIRVLKQLFYKYKVKDCFGYGNYAEIHIAIARNPCTTSEILDIIAKTGASRNVLLNLVENKNTLHTTLSFLAHYYINYGVSGILCSIAKNPNISPDILILMAKNCSYSTEMRIAIANNKNSTSEILEIILNSCGEKYQTGKMCLAIANHPNSSHDILEFLAKSSDKKVVNAALKNPNSPPDISVCDFKNRKGKVHTHEAQISTNINTSKQSTGFKIPLPPEPLQFNTDRVAEIKSESKKLSAMLNAIYEQDETPPVVEKSEPQSTQSVLNLDETHLEIVKILATKPEWERQELQKMMKGMMIDGVLEHINDAFFDCCDEAFIESDDPIEINVRLYEENFLEKIK